MSMRDTSSVSEAAKGVPGSSMLIILLGSCGPHRQSVPFLNQQRDVAVISLQIDCVRLSGYCGESLRPTIPDAIPG